MRILAAAIALVLPGLSGVGDIGPAPDGSALLIAQAIIGRVVKREECPSVVVAFRLPDGTIRAACDNGEDFRVVSRNGSVEVLHCTVQRKYGYQC